jgi:hypothetical protein
MSHQAGAGSDGSIGWRRRNRPWHKPAEGPRRGNSATYEYDAHGSGLHRRCRTRPMAVTQTNDAGRAHGSGTMYYTQMTRPAAGSEGVSTAGSIEERIYPWRVGGVPEARIIEESAGGAGDASMGWTLNPAGSCWWRPDRRSRRGVYGRVAKPSPARQSLQPAPLEVVRERAGDSLARRNIPTGQWARRRGGR